MAAFDPKPGMSTEELRARLVQAIVAYDRKMSARLSAHWSPRALGHYLKAVERIDEEVASGADFAEAVMACLNPAPWIRTWLRKLDPAIDVRRGTWTRGGRVVRY